MSHRSSMGSGCSAAVIEILGRALRADGIEDLSREILSGLTELAGTTSFLYLSDARLSWTWYVDTDLPPTTSDVVASACPLWFDQLADSPGGRTDVRGIVAGETVPFTLHRLAAGERSIGLLGVRAGHPMVCSEELWLQLLESIASAVVHLLEQAAREKKLLHLNTYLTVSSMLAKSIDLAELLEIALFCSMEAVSAEAASILLLDDAKDSFRFYRAEGPAKPLLGGTSFPAAQGVAGRVLRNLEAEIVHDAGGDAQFYEQIDRETGFRTRNMIAVPLVAGEEPVGVLEVLNKAEGGSFTPDERLILESVADEIAFAIRNATLFDYVVNTYCKRRQGQNSCKGCERPLGSWTPCMRYREFLP